MSECKVPWCSNDATDIIGEWWHTRFCDEHIYTLEHDSYIYLDPTVIDDLDMVDMLSRQFIKNMQGCTIRDADVAIMYNVEKMWYVISFDVDALRKKFDDRNMIFIEKEVV